jgi:hypothetical protein
VQTSELANLDFHLDKIQFAESANHVKFKTKKKSLSGLQSRRHCTSRRRCSAAKIQSGKEKLKRQNAI